MLTVKRAKDRQIMANQITTLCEAFGATATQKPMGDREIWVNIDLSGAYVTIDIDGKSNNDFFVIPWNSRNTKFSEAFGFATFAVVNPYHRKKCMGTATNFNELQEYLRNALTCIQKGLAFEPTA